MKLEEKRYKNFFRSKLVLFFLIFIFFMISFYATGSLYQNYQIRKEIAILDKKIAELNDKNEELKLSENKLTDSDFIEREARLKLNFKKDGEELVIFTEDPYSSNPKENKEERRSGEEKKHIFDSDNVKKWLAAIFGS